MLEAALAADGWQIVDRINNLALGPYDEVWTIESLFDPVGLHAFVGFLLEPEPPSPKGPQRGPAYAVECISTSPFEAGITGETIAWESLTQSNQGVVKLVEGLARFRNRSG